MAKYTITVKEMKEQNKPLWQSSFDVSGYIDATGYFTTAKWTALKTLMEKHFYYREIGFETLERFYHYMELTFMENIEKFKKLWNAYNQAIETIYDNIQSGSGTNSYEELPQTTGALLTNWGTSRNNSSVSNKNSTKAQIDLLDNYFNKLRDIDVAFIEVFNSCFMGVY